MLLLLPSHTEENPLIRKHLWGLKMMGYIIFEDQKNCYLHVFRGYFFSVTFTLFNITQVSHVMLSCVKKATNC